MNTKPMSYAEMISELIQDEQEILNSLSHAIADENYARVGALDEELAETRRQLDFYTKAEKRQVLMLFVQDEARRRRLADNEFSISFVSLDGIPSGKDHSARHAHTSHDLVEWWLKSERFGRVKVFCDRTNTYGSNGRLQRKEYLYIDDRKVIGNGNE